MSLTREKILAMLAGPELDALVAVRVLDLRAHEEEDAYGYGQTRTVWRTREGYKWYAGTDFSRDNGLAFLVLEKLREGNDHLRVDMHADRTREGGWWVNAEVDRHDYRGPHFQAEGATAAEAICKVALLIILEEKP